MGFGSCTQHLYVKEPPLISPLKCNKKKSRTRGDDGRRCGCVNFTLFYHLLSSTVWQNGGDRQHPEPRLCAKVHLGLLF